MYSLAFPVTLPEDRAYHFDDRAVVQAVSTYPIACNELQSGNPQIFTFNGFADAQTAEEFASRLGDAFLCASLTLPHGFQPPNREINVTELRWYDGHTPTIYPTAVAANAMTANGHVTMSAHLSTLATQLDYELRSGAVDRIRSRPELATAVRLFSESVFAGGLTARFVVLLSALEVLITSTSNNKRGLVRKLVTETLRDNGRSDAKAIGARLDKLYMARNALVHEARAVAIIQVQELEEIVRETLRLQVDTN